MNDVARFNVIPPLENGDHLTREEFERRYEATPNIKKAELIEGVVFMPSRVSFRHAGPHSDLSGWILVYRASTPGTDSGNDATVRLDRRNEPQPDGILLINPECGGQMRLREDSYLEGAPELAFEIASSTASIDLGWKRDAYLRNKVREYLVYRVLDGEVDWFILRNGLFDRLTQDAGGIIRGETFPGLWLDVPALIRRDLATVLAILQQGIASPEHAAFVQSLQQRRGGA